MKNNNQNNYNEDSIKSLDWKEHIRLRPGMYIGKLGDGSSIGAGSVVTGTVSENTIFAGNPAKFVKHIK